MREEVERALDAIKALEAIPDAGERAVALGQFLKKVPEVHRQAREMRQQAVLTMRQQGMSWTDIGEVLEVHRTRARQIAMGESWRTRKTADGSADAPDAPADDR